MHTTFTESSRLKAHADSLVRCSPGEDGTNGFFVSLFVRRSNAHGEQSEMRIDSKKRKTMSDENDELPATKRKRKKKKKSKSAIVS